ncbi:glycosyltransferase family protein [Deinococcus malanensis]|uniref:glycosyltransferase family protein n=1 Tax=Deinococcus malanensis TaxID=1706855 RepID=UPI003643D141
MGLGHTRRNLLIAQALTAANPELSALMITGARTSSAFSYPPGVDCLTLPALHKEATGAYRSRSLHLSLGAMARLRSATMMAALEAFSPNVLIVDNVPLGAVQELKEVLRFLRTGGQTRCVLGLRDVLDEPSAVREEWQRLDNEGAIRRWYDEVWVYGDPGVYDLAREYQLSPDIAARVRYTGYLDRESHQRHTEAEEILARLELPAGPVVVCLAGGGQDGAELIRAFGGPLFRLGRPA